MVSMKAAFLFSLLLAASLGTADARRLNHEKLRQIKAGIKAKEFAAKEMAAKELADSSAHAAKEVAADHNKGEEAKAEAKDPSSDKQSAAQGPTVGS